MNDYNDIIRHPHFVHPRRRPMPRQNRAAQFAPFAALTGYDEEIGEAGRLTEQRHALTEDEQDALNLAVQQLLNCGEQPHITVIYFEPDAHKNGGAYRKCCGHFRRIDYETGKLIFTERHAVSLKWIVRIVFDDMENENK